MCIEYSYNECMETCLEYATTVYQAEEEDAIVYCREKCVPLKRKNGPRGDLVGKGKALVRANLAYSV